MAEASQHVPQYDFQSTKANCAVSAANQIVHRVSMVDPLTQPASCADLFTLQVIV